MPTALPEAWLRGPIDEVPPLLQPVAHALVQAAEDVRAIALALDTDALWARPAGAASCAFHVRHAARALDRLFTYARGESLNDAQRAALAEESADLPRVDGEALVAEFDAAVSRAFKQLRRTDESTLLEARGVGRAQLPSTVIGLLFHAAEHTQRHMGQLVTTARVARLAIASR